MTIDWNAKPCIYTVPAGVSFVETLARGVLSMAGDDPMELAQIQILLPTRRACRSLREAFLKITEGKPLLLPRMQPIGDVDEEELSLLLSGLEDDLSLPPAISSLRRQFMLARLISGLETHSRGFEQDMALATALGKLMDQVYTEDLDLKNLADIVDRERFSEHWQISLDFLSILSEHWPRILAENGVMDSADRRNRLIKKLAEHWASNPPKHKVIAAGSTGSIPATAELLKVVAKMDHGCIVLPGLDQILDEESWNALEETHPQITLRHLLRDVLEVERGDVKLWPYDYGDHVPTPAFARLTSEMMRPAATAHKWQELTSSSFKENLTLFPELYECANPQEEALVIAMAMREALQEPRTTAALVTPDRRLARRVAMACRRWGIEVDDSAGQPLSQTTIGTYLRLCLEAVNTGLKPVSLVTFLKHGLCQPFEHLNWREDVRYLDRHVLRGPAFRGGMDALYSKLRGAEEKKGPMARAENILGTIAKGFAPLLALTESSQTHAFNVWYEAHLQVASYFSPDEILWAGREGESASSFMSELRDEGHLLPDVTLPQYIAILEQTMASIAVRPAYGLHPRLMILGQLEARLVEADVMILSGLNENTWPPDPGIDPWMSRPMRKTFGLPPLERGIALSAHDFAQAFGAKKVVMTRSVRVDGTPTVPSRWLQRLDTVLQASGLQPSVIRKGALLTHARTIDYIEDFNPVERPAPKPPVDVRPRKLSVTQIETWMQDPYSIYARHILRLRKLDPLEQDMDAALRGTLVHAVLDRFVGAFMNDIPSHADRTFLTITQEELDALGVEEDVVTLWQPRLSKIGDWVIAKEKDWRKNFRPSQLEASGSYTINTANSSFTVTARADRLDTSLAGTEAAIIDYKTGGQYSGTKMKEGYYPQLPLEALILEHGGFENFKAVPVTGLYYWIVNGGKEGGKEQGLSKPSDLQIAKENAEQGLKDLAELFEDPNTPYYSLPRPEFAPRFNDYEHLARVKEWTALDEQEDAA